MAKKVTQVIKLQAPAGSATPQPPLGPVLGQAGVNIMEFCKAFNAKTQEMDKGAPIPVVLTVYQDRSFTFETKTPPASYLLIKAANLQKGTGLAGRESAGQVKRSQVKKIAEQKMQDLNANSIEAAIKIIEGTARSSGIEVVEG